MILSHRIALDPTEKQRRFFARACGVKRFTWNWALAELKAGYENTKKFPKISELKKRWNQTKPAWVYDSPKDANQRAFSDLQKALSTFFKAKKARNPIGFPKFKKRGEGDSFYLCNDQFKLDGNRVRIPLLGWVRLRESLRFQGKIMSATVSRTADRWFISIAVEGDFSKPRIADGIVGVDLGLNHLAVTSDGVFHENPKPLKQNLTKLRRYQRMMSRRVKGSQNRAKAKLKVARLHARISNIRKDNLHKLTTDLCRENQAAVIEDLHVKGMVKNRKLARSISDAGFGGFRRQLEYKAKLFGTEVIVADRFYPSSKTCSACGQINSELTLRDRTFSCSGCGQILDRDLNAAKNLHTLGLRGIHAHGLQVNPGEACLWPVKKVEVGTRSGSLVSTN